MEPYLKKVLCIALILTTCSASVSAAPAVIIPPHYNFEAIEKATTETQQKIYDTITEMNKLDTKLSRIIDEININKNKIFKLTEDIDKNSKQIEITKKDLADSQKLFNNRIRTMYIYQSNDSKLDALLSSKGVGDFLGKISAIKAITEYDNSIIDKLKLEKEKLKIQEDNLKKAKDEVVKLNQETIKKQSSLAEEKDKLMLTLATLNIIRGQEIQSAEVKYLQEKLTQDYLTYQFSDLRLPKEVIESKNSLDFYAAVDLDTPIKVSGQDIVMYASSLMGIGYLWGGNDAKGLDCSGYTKYVYKHFGIIIPRVAEDQQKTGIDVPTKAELQPGDLLFFGQPANHVAIFITKGFMLEAPYTGEVIKVSPIREYTNAKRYVGLSKEQLEILKRPWKKSMAQPNELDDNVQILPVVPVEPVTTTEKPNVESDKKPELKK